MMLVCGKGFSQTDIKSKVVIDTSIARKIAIDLVKGDECKEELKIVYKNIDLFKSKIVVKDSIIKNHKNQIVNLNKMVEGKDKLLQISDENLTNAKKEIKKNKAKTFFWKTATLVTMGFFSYYLIK